jgi:hypothetical protein
MAEIKIQQNFDLLALPGPALEAVARAVRPNGSLLRTNTACRDAVLATCTHAELRVYEHQTSAQVRAHQPLLLRVGNTAAPGLVLWLEGKRSGAPRRPTLLLSDLLASSTPLELPRVHHLDMQVMYLQC